MTYLVHVSRAATLTVNKGFNELNSGTALLLILPDGEVISDLHKNARTYKSFIRFGLH